MKDFVIGFLSCACLCIFMGSQQIYNSHPSQSETDREFDNLYAVYQTKGSDVLTSTPAYTALVNGQIVKVNSGGVHSLVWRDNQNVYSVTGTVR